MAIFGMLSLDVIHRSGNPTQNSQGASRMIANHSTGDLQSMYPKKNMVLQGKCITFAKK